MLSTNWVRHQPRRSSKVPVTSDDAAYLCGFSDYNSLLKKKMVEIKPRPNVELFMGQTKLYFGSTYIKLRTSVRSDVEPRTRQTNKLNRTKKQF